MQVKYIVQDLETFEFLYPENGDVGQTPLIKLAGHFEELEDAVASAEDNIGGAYTIFKFYLPE